MLVDRIVKETTDISRDFLDMSWWLDEGETITKVVSQTVILGAYGWSDAPYPLQGGEMPYDPFPLEIDSAVVAAGGTQLEVFVSEGSPSLAYTCQFVLDGSSTRRVTIEMGVQVTGVPLGALGSGPLPSYLAVTIADTPPSDPQPGQLWFDSIDPQLYIWYDDPSSSQWVIVTSDKGGLATDAPYDGGIYSRQNGVWVLASGFGAFLPLVGNATVTGPIVYNPSPQNTAAGVADYDFLHQTPAVVTAAHNLHFVQRVILEPGPSDSTNYWGIVSRCRTASTDALANLVGGYFQTWRLAGSSAPLWAAIAEAADFTGLNSSAVGAATSSMEIDLGTTGLDDATNPSMFGGIGNRHFVHFVATRNQGVAENEISTGLWFGTNQTRIDSVIGFQVASRFYQALDTRGTLAPLGVTDPVCSVRMAANQIIDFQGGPALNSPPGSYLQYTDGPNRFRYMSGGNELLSIEDTGVFLTYGAVGINAPNAPGIQVEIGGTATVGLRTSGTFTTGVRVMDDQRLSLTSSDSAYLQYRASTGRLYCVMAGVDAWSIDATGNVRARGTLTGSTTP